jgi:hypothetical protein
MARSIKFYTRPKYLLCDEVRILLNQLRKEYPLDFEEVNILEGPDLSERSKYEIPVLPYSDQFYFQGGINAKRLREIGSNF